MATQSAHGASSAPHTRQGVTDGTAATVLLKGISWGAVFAGVVVALALHLLLNLLGIGIGVATLDPASGSSPTARTFSIAAGLWWTVAGIIAAFGGGYAAGRLSGRPDPETAGWHGLSSWAVTTLLIFVLIATTAGAVVGGAYNLVANAAGGAGRTVATAAQVAAPAITEATDPFASIEQSMRSASGGNDPAALRDAAISAMRGILTGDPAQAQEGRERASQVLAKAQNISIEEARTRVDEYEAQYRQLAERAKQRATEVADATATRVSQAALVGFLALALGAIAGWFGGRAGSVYPANWRISTGRGA